MSIKQNIESIRATLPSTVQLVAVSKFHPAETIEEAYKAGQRIFGESRAQELTAKAARLPKEIEWHFIGHLQTNKVKQIVPLVSLIHSVDHLGLIEEINRQGEKYDRTVDCLLQIHIAREESKFGFSFDECRALFAGGLLSNFPYVRIRGLMGMATFTDNTAVVEAEFEQLSRLFQELSTRYHEQLTAFDQLSMGMSDDYLLALRHGTTLVRIGSKLFGQRV